MGGAARAHRALARLEDPQLAARFAVGAFMGLEGLAADDPNGQRLGMSADEYLRFVGGALGLQAPTLG